jgi:2-isopropylmalate synthase
LAKVKEMEAKGYHFEMAQGTLELLIRKEMGDFEPPFQAQSFTVVEENDADFGTYTSARVKIAAKNTKIRTEAKGDGPVNALDNALTKALGELYPSIKDIKLTDFKVRVLEGSAGTEAVVRVLIESSDGVNSWGTIGVSTNIIEASWNALLDSVYYKLYRYKEKK